MFASTQDLVRDRGRYEPKIIGTFLIHILFFLIFKFFSQKHIVAN